MKRTVATPLVCHFLLDHRVGGPHVYVDTLRKFMSKRIESCVITTGHGPMTDYSLLNLRHIWSPFYALELIVNIFILLSWLISGKIRRQGVLFAVHGGINLAPLVAARLLGIPVVWYIHETTPRFCNVIFLGKMILRGGRHKVVVVAHKASEVYQLSNSIFIPGSVDPQFWSLNKVSSADIIACNWAECAGKRSIRLLTVGNINPLKGFEVLLDALSTIDGHWHLKVVGAELETHRDYALSLYKKVDEITQSQNNVQIDFLGWQDKEKVRAYMASCDLFILPSYSEACPLVLLEALAMGCTCLATNVGDIALMLADAHESMIFTAGDVGQCRNAINYFMARQMRFHRRAAYIGNDWQLTTVIAKTEQLYLRLLNTIT